MISLKDFVEDKQGAKFKDVLDDRRIDYEIVISFFNDDLRRIRLVDSEVHHDRPPLAGVIKEFERIPEINHFFENSDGHSTQRFRQSIGVLVRLHMDELGYKPAGRKGSLGTRLKVEAGTIAPGAYKNKNGISTWFTRAERYVEKDN